jgi:hypothetical protein
VKLEYISTKLTCFNIYIYTLFLYAIQFCRAIDNDERVRDGSLARMISREESEVEEAGGV